MPIGSLQLPGPQRVGMDEHTAHSQGRAKVVHQRHAEVDHTEPSTGDPLALPVMQPPHHLTGQVEPAVPTRRNWGRPMWAHESRVLPRPVVINGRGGIHPSGETHPHRARLDMLAAGITPRKRTRRPTPNILDHPPNIGSMSQWSRSHVGVRLPIRAAAASQSGVCALTAGTTLGGVLSPPRAATTSAVRRPVRGASRDVAEACRRILLRFIAVDEGHATGRSQVRLERRWRLPPRPRKVTPALIRRPRTRPMLYPVSEQISRMLSPRL